MGQKPLILRNPNIAEILDCIDEGLSVREISIRFNVTQGAVRKLLKMVKLRNTPDTEKALEALNDMGMKPEEISDNLPSTRLYGGVDILEEMLSMKQSADRLMKKAEKADRLSQAVSALREQMRIIETMMKMADLMRRRQEFNPWNHPDVIAYQEGLLEIIRKHPKALEDVINYVSKYSGRTKRPTKEGESE